MKIRSNASSRPSPGVIKGWRRRQGSLAIAVLVCVFVVSTITISCLSISSRYRRQLQNELREEQTQWILDCGVRRAISRVSSDTGYQGETLEMKTNLPVYDRGQLQIRTATEEGDQVELLIVAILFSNKNARTNSRLTKFKRSTSLLVPIEK